MNSTSAADLEQWDSLSSDEQDVLEESVRLTLEQGERRRPTLDGDIEALSQSLAQMLAGTYTSAVAAGVCREGALELFSDAVRERLE